MDSVSEPCQVMECLAPHLVPMWEAQAVWLGLPRSMGGIFRFHLAAAACEDPEIEELMWRTCCGVAQACQFWLLPKRMQQLARGEDGAISDAGVRTLFSSADHAVDAADASAIDVAELGGESDEEMRSTGRAVTPPHASVG